MVVLKGFSNNYSDYNTQDVYYHLLNVTHSILLLTLGSTGVLSLPYDTTKNSYV